MNKITINKGVKGGVKIILRDNLFCFDCKKYTYQNFKREMPDNTLLYQCEKCGCENSEEKE